MKRQVLLELRDNQRRRNVLLSNGREGMGDLVQLTLGYAGWQGDGAPAMITVTLEAGDHMEGSSPDLGPDQQELPLHVSAHRIVIPPDAGDFEFREDDGWLKHRWPDEAWHEHEDLSAAERCWTRRLEPDFSA